MSAATGKARSTGWWRCIRVTHAAFRCVGSCRILLLGSSRTFEDRSKIYSVTRVYDGTIEEEGRMLTAAGDIKIQDSPVGFFKILFITPQIMSNKVE